MNRIVFILIPVLVLLFSGCAKVDRDVDNFYPKVRTTNVTVLPNGDVRVTGEIISEGTTPLSFAGFCMDTLPNPRMLSNQVSVDSLYGNTFTATYKALEKSYTYYFRAWAANQKGYAIGGDVSVSDVTMDSTFIPCTLPIDTLTLVTPSSAKNYKYREISNIEQLGFEWRIDLYAGTSSIEIVFGRRPTSGVYRIVHQNEEPRGFAASIMIDNIIQDYNGDIYVREIDANTIEVAICKIEWHDLYERSLKTKFRASYQ